MTSPGCFFDRLVNVEPTLEVDRPWHGRFEADGHGVDCVLVDGWVRLSSPVDADARTLVRQHVRLALPVKGVAGPALTAEMPVGDDLAATFSLLREGLRQGLALAAGAELGCEGTDRVAWHAQAALQPLLDESEFVWRHDGESEQLFANVGGARVAAFGDGTSVRFRTDVLPLGRADGPSLDALAEYVLAIDARFRFVRGAFLSDRLVLEVAVPVRALTPVVVDRAARTIGDCLRLTRRACAALVEGDVAHEYLQFHHQKEDVHADHHH
jgi:hypothetical protein